MSKVFITKTAQAFQLLDNGDFKKALAIFKTFKLGLTKEEREAIQITHEVETGKGSFYSALGTDIAAMKELALVAIAKLRKELKEEKNETIFC